MHSPEKKYTRRRKNTLAEKYTRRKNTLTETNQEKGRVEKFLFFLNQRRPDIKIF